MRALTLYIEIIMKSIVSPFDDIDFNKFLLRLCKVRLKKSIEKIKDNRPYEVFGNKYSTSDILKLLTLRGRVIYFSDSRLLNYLVYDLSQRFWYEDLNFINNAIHYLYLKFNSFRRRRDD